MKRHTYLGGALALALAAGVTAPLALDGTGATAAHAKSHAPSLFGAAPAAAARQAPDLSRGTAKRSRYVSFKGALLASTARNQKLDLPFFDDADFTGTVDTVDKQKLFTSWSGPLDTSMGSFVITKSAGRYSVTASTLQGTYTMEQTNGGQFQVQEVVQPQPTENDIATQNQPSASSRHAAKAASSAPVSTQASSKGKRATVGDDGSTIDLLVMYTPAAEATYGGLAGIQAEAAKNVAYTNAALVRSGVALNARLAAVMPTATAELGGDSLGTDLQRLETPGDGYYEEVFADILATHADDTILLAKPPPANAGICGIGSLDKDQPAKYAFAVVSTGNCTNGYYSFPHELGHNMGATHDKYTLQDGGVGTGDFQPQAPYGYGYVDPNFAFYTMMAYYDQCRDQGTTTAQKNCPSLLNYSNPAVTYGGRTTGTADSSNVATLLGQTRTTVAAHQQSQLYPTPVNVKGKVKPGNKVHAKFLKWINTGVKYRYSWYRDGKLIKGAKHKTYKIKGRDRGRKLSVLVTGVAPYYTPVAVGSKARNVKGGKHKHGHHGHGHHGHHHGHGHHGHHHGHHGHHHGSAVNPTVARTLVRPNAVSSI